MTGNLYDPACLRVLQNNKALKPNIARNHRYARLRVLQNNKALKRIGLP